MRVFSLILLLVFLGSSTTLEAQKRVRKRKTNDSRFRVSLLLGTYGAQVDGDNFNGFNKAALSSGLRATILLREHIDFNIELLYQQKGSVFELFPMGDKDRALNLTYIEVPLIFRYYPLEEKKGVNIDVGLAYGRLINTTVVEVPSELAVQYEELALDFKSNELSLILGLGYQFTPHFSIGGRYSFSLSAFYNNSENINLSPFDLGQGKEIVTYLRNYLIGVYVAYTF